MTFSEIIGEKEIIGEGCYCSSNYIKTFSKNILVSPCSDVVKNILRVFKDGLVNNITLLTKPYFFSFNWNTVPDKGSESKFLDILEASKKLYFSSSEGGNLIVSWQRISLLKFFWIFLNFWYFLTKTLLFSL